MGRALITGSGYGKVVVLIIRLVPSMDNDGEAFCCTGHAVHRLIRGLRRLKHRFRGMKRDLRDKEHRQEEWQEEDDQQRFNKGLSASTGLAKRPMRTA